ncbi:MAG: imidazole glycerol phosphate synthase subunit HisH [Thermoanaerobaculia bacterium]|nr:imidazole glycerol phosphate synthase subunit HisH [Thermoanaerobaculia bacterium]
MSAEPLILDLGVGNLGNVARALTAAGARPIVSADPAAVRVARRIVLPGVGAFRPPRERLRGALEEALRAALAGGAHLLGICVGYQLLFEGSDEFGATGGLALLAGRITELPATVSLPHIGWNRLETHSPHPLLDGLESDVYVYFVHSFAPDADAGDGAPGKPDTETVATALHGRRFAAVSARDRICGTQFHPEKSGEAGLRVLRNFLALSGGDGACN